MKLAVIATVATLMAGCATTPDIVAVDPAFDPAATEFTGWVRFSGEEFQLYADEIQVLRPFARPCVSGALPRDLQRQAAGDLGGMEVRVTGRTQAWSDDLPGHRIDRDGSAIRNECGGPFVILADSMSPISPVSA